MIPVIATGVGFLVAGLVGLAIGWKVHITNTYADFRASL